MPARCCSTAHVITTREAWYAETHLLSHSSAIKDNLHSKRLNRSKHLYSTHSKNLKVVLSRGAYVRDTGLNVVQISPHTYIQVSDQKAHITDHFKRHKNSDHLANLF